MFRTPASPRLGRGSRGRVACITGTGPEFPVNRTYPCPIMLAKQLLVEIHHLVVVVCPTHFFCTLSGQWLNTSMLAGFKYFVEILTPASLEKNITNNHNIMFYASIFHRSNITRSIWETRCSATKWCMMYPVGLVYISHWLMIYLPWTKQLWKR